MDNSLDGTSDMHPEFTDVKLSSVRKSIGKAMRVSLATMAQLTHHFSFDAARMLGLRKELKENEGAEESGITLNDMMLFAVSRILPCHRELNAHFLEDRIRIFSAVNLGFAVNTERGLLVPTIYHADRKSLLEISREANRLAKAAQTGRIDTDLMKNATFTVSNLGTIGVEFFTPVINPPQTAILGVGSIVWRVKEEDGGFSHYPAMGLSLTYDHRAVDGVPAARFSMDLVKTLEEFNIQ